MITRMCGRFASSIAMFRALVITVSDFSLRNLS